MRTPRTPRTRSAGTTKSGSAPAIRTFTSKPGKTPVLVLSEATQGRRAKRYVVMTIEDFQEWFGKVEVR
mgnify:CR=1 FL=1